MGADWVDVYIGGRNHTQLIERMTGMPAKHRRSRVLASGRLASRRCHGIKFKLFALPVMPELAVRCLLAVPSLPRLSAVCLTAVPCGACLRYPFVVRTCLWCLRWCLPAVPVGGTHLRCLTVVPCGACLRCMLAVHACRIRFLVVPVCCS